MKSRFKIIVIFVITILLFFSCCKEGESNMNSYDYLLVYTNPIASSASNINGYSLSSLLNYFGTISPNETLEYSGKIDKSHLSFECINEYFPVETIKRSNTISFYSSYKVIEGGRYYVFWDTPSNFYSTYDVKLLCCRLTIYIPSISNSNVFCKLNEKQSTAEDVFRICPSTELCFTMSSGIYSFSLLDGGIIAEIRYEKKNHVNSRRELIVDSITFHNINDYLGTSYLATIDPNDLP